MSETPSADDHTGAAPDPDAHEPGAGARETGYAKKGSGEYLVLARKYRPATFDELIGQEALVRTLTNAIRVGRVAHAFILAGVRGIGKTSTARIIARALNCVGPDGKGGPTAEPCGVCEFCASIAADRNIDVIEMDAASSAGVAEIRELIDGVRYKPVSARYKIYIIDEVHMLSPRAFDALLKTLEEPPEHVKFVFATTEIRKVPVTVLSRCQRFDLRRLDWDTLTAHLSAIAAKERARIQSSAIALLARAADGSVRDGLSLLDQAIAQLGTEHEVTGDDVRAMLGLADRAQVLDLFQFVMKGDVKGALDLVAAMYAAGADPAVVLQDLLDVTHWLTRLKVVPDAAEGTAVSEAERGRAREMADALPMPVLTRGWQILVKGLSEVQAAAQPLTALEMLLVRMAYAAELPTPADIIAELDDAAGDGAGNDADSGRGAAEASAGTGREGGAGGTGEGGAVARDAPGASTAPVPGPADSKFAHEPRGALAARVEPQLLAPETVATSAPEPAAAPQPGTFEQVVELVAARKEGILQSHLMGSVHLVRFEPGRIEFRPAEGAPRDLANRLGEILTKSTGRRWVVTVSQEPGAPTLREQRAESAAARKREAARDPLVRAVLDTFPGAEIGAVRDLERGGDAAGRDEDGPPEDADANSQRTPG